jgi:hypothetical protein
MQRHAARVRYVGPPRADRLLQRERGYHECPRHGDYLRLMRLPFTESERQVTDHTTEPELVNPTVEDAYWRENFKTRAYASGDTYDRWRAAYRYGWHSYTQHRGQPFDEVEPAMQHEWDNSKDGSLLTWEKAKDASRDAWARAEIGTIGVNKDGR